MWIIVGPIFAHEGLVWSELVNRAMHMDLVHHICLLLVTSIFMKLKEYLSDTKQSFQTTKHCVNEEQSNVKDDTGHGE